MLLEFPTKFNVDYPNENYAYYNNGDKKSILKNKLIESSGGYCMYCGHTIMQEDIFSGHLEHTIEKSQKNLHPFMHENSNNFILSTLNHCKFNIGLACSICNERFKKAYPLEATNNLLPFLNTKTTYSNMCKKQKVCTKSCKFLKACEEEHARLHKIIRMPRNNDTYPHRIMFDCTELIYIVANDNNYNDDDKDIINAHILQFRFNELTRGLSILKSLCNFIVNNKKLPKSNEIIITHILGKIFLNKLNTLPLNHAIDYCKNILLASKKLKETNYTISNREVLSYGEI